MTRTLCRVSGSVLQHLRLVGAKFGHAPPGSLLLHRQSRTLGIQASSFILPSFLPQSVPAKTPAEHCCMYLEVCWSNSKLFKVLRRDMHCLQASRQSGGMQALFVSTSADGTAQLWSTSTWTCLRVFQIPGIPCPVPILSSMLSPR